MYYLGLSLSCGRVTNYTGMVESLSTASPLAPALRSLVAAVNSEDRFVPGTPTNASQFLGRSYYLQSRRQLSAALDDARAAVRLNHQFAFAWERLAELEFSAGRVSRAGESMNRALELSPRNAHAHALKGFLLLGRDRVDAAVSSFDRALELDARLGNAWLGRGLCRWRQGNPEAGLADIEKAAVMEPNRWLFRSYLGKSFGLAANHAPDAAGRARLARLSEAELELAKRQDPLDPTPWLYSALLREQENRNVEAVRELEKSSALNDNRQVFRSRLLLDEDRAVRGANLARIYERAGLPELSIQAAARAANADYASYSPHRFLADSYNALRDPKRVDLRYEEAWSNEQLMANLLTSGGGGSLSRFVSQACSAPRNTAAPATGGKPRRNSARSIACPTRSTWSISI
jgi:tetratricopeptide (TPR) repeat protein